MTSGHPLDADRQRDGHHRRQALRNHRDREPDHHHERVGHGVAAPGHGQGEDPGRDREGDQGDLAGEAIHLPDERRAQRLHLAEQGADPPEFGGGTGGDGDTGAAAAGHEGAGERHGPAIAQGGAGWHGLSGLLDRHRLAGQCRLLDLQMAGTDEPQVGR